MKKSILILGAAVLIGLFSCNNKVNSDAQAAISSDTLKLTGKSQRPDTLHYKDQVITPVELDSNSFLDLADNRSKEESAGRSFDSLNVWVHDSTIVFRLESGDSVKIISMPNDPTDGIVKHNYENFVPALNSYLILNTYYESGDFSIINRKSGKEIHLYGEPVLSPDKKLAVSSNYDVMTGESPNGFQILSIQSEKTDILWEANTRSWGPKECRWKDNTTLYIKAVCICMKDKFFKLSLPDFEK